MLQNFLYSLNATVPVFAVMVLGWLLKRAGFLTEEFIRTANKLVFHVALPAMLFLDIAQMDPTQLLDGRFVAFGAAVTLVSILLIWLLSRLLMKHKEQVGAFVQGAYRSSAAILGAALITNVYGDAGYAPLMILASVPLYNIFAVLILVLESGGDGHQGGAGVKRAAVNVCKNPIILGIVAGMPFALLQLKLPAMVTKTVSLVGQLATPLALLAIGAGFVWQNARQRAVPAAAASLIKLVLLPAVFLPLAIALGFRNEQLMALLIMLGSPSTPSGYIMAKQMGADAELSSGVVVLTTLLGLVADAICVSANYHSRVRNVIGYGVFTAWFIGPFLPIFLNSGTYFQQMDQQMGKDYSASMAQLFSPTATVLFAVVGMVIGLIGGWIGTKLIDKHFAKAGMVA